MYSTVHCPKNNLNLRKKANLLQFLSYCRYPTNAGITFLSPNLVIFGFVLNSRKIKKIVFCRKCLKCFKDNYLCTCKSYGPCLMVFMQVSPLRGVLGPGTQDICG